MPASRRTSLIGLAGWLLIAWLGAPAPASATTYVWNGPNAGSWTDPNNWNPSTGIPHGDGDIAIIQARATSLAIAIPTPEIRLQQLVFTGTGQPVTLVGASATLVFNQGSLVPAIVSDSNGPVIQVPVIFENDGTVHVVSGSLTFQLTVAERGGTWPFVKTGAGAAIFNSSISYSGTTTIQEGILRLTLPNVMPDTAKVEVRPGATFEPKQNEAIGNLTVVNGVVDIGETVTLSVASLDMTGGIVRPPLSGGVATLRLRGDVTMTSSSTQTAVVQANVFLENGPRTFIVADGPLDPDARIDDGMSGDSGQTVGLIKHGPGSLLFQFSGKYNSYSGSTWVKQGRLVLNNIVPADLRVGDGIGPADEAVVDGLPSNDDQRVVVVEADGLFAAKGKAAIDRLTINGGTTTVHHASSELSVRALGMNGGVLDLGLPGTSGGAIRLKNVTDVRLDITSTATQTPIVRGTGRLVLDGSPDMAVHDGPLPIDLRIEAAIVSSTSQGLTKSGPGVAQLVANNTYSGPTFVSGGTLLIDATQPSTINLTGGRLGGTGRAGPIVGSAGTIAPGHSPGVLDSGSLTLSADVTLALELYGTAAGTTYDRLAVTGTVTLANATLAAVIAPNVTLPPGATLTIIDNDGTDAITGTFADLAEGARLVVGSHAFTVSYQGGTGNDVVLTVTGAEADTLSYYLAEGATGGFFDEDVAIANPNDTDAPITLTFLQEGGGTVVERRTMPKQGRLTVHVDQIAGLENASPSVQVGSDQTLPLVVERTMFWDPSSYGGHTANAVAKPETTWILAEGFQGFFDTYLLIANANATATTATVTFLRENDTPVVKTFPIGAFARKTIYAGEFSELIGRAFGMVVEATLPVIAERSMYFASIPNRLWTGGHVNTGVTAPSTSWFHAEGATGGFFSTFILLSNPQTTEAHVELRFLLEDGTTIVKTKTLPAGQRLTVNPAAEGEPRLENAALSTVVTSDVPIVSERSMYWPGDAVPFGEGHNSSGVVSTATRWGLAEGRIGAPRNFTTYILLANPTTTPAEVTVTYLREAGAAITKTYSVPATSRFNIDVAGAVPELHDESFGARIEVTNGVAIAVERSLYWDANGIFWAGGTNALATPIP